MRDEKLLCKIYVNTPLISNKIYFSPFTLKTEYNLHHVHLAEHHNLHPLLHPPHSYLHPHCTIIVCVCVCMGIIVHHNHGRIKHHKSLASHPVFKNANMEGEEGVDSVQWRLFLYFLSITPSQQPLVSTVNGHCDLPLLSPCSCTEIDHYY